MKPCADAWSVVWLCCLPLTCLACAAAFPSHAESAPTDENPRIGDHTLREWKELLGTADPDARSDAALALGRTRSAVAVPVLIETLENDKHSGVRSRAALGLGLIGTDAAIAALLRTLDNDRLGEGIRGSAALALGSACRRHPKHAPQVISALVAAFRIRGLDGHARSMAADGIARLGPIAVPALVEAINNAGSGQGEVFRAAASALRQIGRPAVPALIRALPQARGRAQAAFARLLGDSRSAEVVPVLISALRDEETVVRRASAFALGRIGPRAAAAVPALMTVLSDPQPRVRSAAVRGLRRLGPRAKEALPRAVRLLKDEDRMVRSGAAGLLAEFSDRQTRFAVPALIAALGDDYTYVRTRSAEALASIGPSAQAAVRPLIKILDRASSDRADLIAAGRALAQIDREAAIAPLIRTLSSRFAYVRSQTARTLGQLGPKATAALPALERATKDRDPSVAKAAAAAIAKIKK